MSLNLSRYSSLALLLLALAPPGQAQAAAASSTSINPTGPGVAASAADLTPTAAADTSAASSTVPLLDAATSDCDSPVETAAPATTTLYQLPYVDYTDYDVVDGTTVETYYETGFSLLTANPYTTGLTAVTFPTASETLQKAQETVTRSPTSPTSRHGIKSTTAMPMLGTVTVTTVMASGTRMPMPEGPEETGMAAGVKASLGGVLVAAVVGVLAGM